MDPEELPPAGAKSSARIALISGIFVVVMMLAVIIFFVFRPNNTPVTINPSPTPTLSSLSPTRIVPSPEPSPTGIPNPSPAVSLAEGEKQYTSPRLDIRFSYLEIPDPFAPNNVDKILVQETGNRIYVYPQSLTPQGGQFVELFQKSANESVEEAIKRIFLGGKDPSRCTVTIGKAPQYPDGFIQAQITFPQTATDTPESQFEKTQYCSETYAQTNGIRYFLFDPAYPEKFLFVSIGQYAITAGNNIPWQQTIRIVN